MKNTTPIPYYYYSYSHLNFDLVLQLNQVQPKYVCAVVWNIVYIQHTLLICIPRNATD